MRLGVAASTPHKGNITTLPGVPASGGGGGEAGPFTPDGATYTNLATLPGTTYAYRADSDSLRLDSMSADGVTIDTDSTIGWMHDWIDPDNSATAAIASNSLHRPTYTTVGGVDALVFDGNQTINDNDRFLLPHIDFTEGALFIVARNTDVTNPNQTLLQTQKFRLQALFTGYVGPTIRFDGNNFVEFDCPPLINRWGCFGIRWSSILGLADIWYDGATEWTRIDLTDLEWSFMGNTLSYINRNEYEPSNGAPASAAHHALTVNSTWDLTQAQLQYMFDFVAEGTSLSATVPDVPDAPDPPSGSVIPAALRTVEVSTTGQLATAITTGYLEGDHIVLKGNCALPSTITSGGTVANPMVIMSDTLLGRTLSGNCTITGDNIYFHGLKNSGDITDDGYNNRWYGVQWQAGATYTPRAATDSVIEYCEWPAIGNNRAIDGQPRNGMRNLTIKNTKFAAWTGITSGGAALVPVRVGANNSENDIDTGVLLENLLFDGENAVVSNGSEWAYEQKGSGGTLRRITVINCNSGKGQIGVRHGHYVRIENCNTANRITVFGGRNATPHTIYNCIASNIRLFAGTIDVEEVFSGAGSNYPNCSNTLVSYCNAPVTVGYMYSSASPPAFDAVNVRLRDHLGGVTLQYETGTTVTGTNPEALPSATPTRVQESEVGPSAIPNLFSDVTPSAVFYNPFSFDSAHHRPIGSGATFSATPPFTGYTSGTVADDNVFSNQMVLATTDDPVAEFTWSGSLTGVGLPFSTRFPASGFPTFTTDPTFDCAVTVVEEDYTGHDIYKIDTRSGVRKAAIHREFDIRGLGHGTTAGFDNRVGASAAGSAVCFGLVRKHEFETPGLVIGHAHQIALPWEGPFYINRDFQAPAVCVDGFAETNSTSAPCAMGEHLAIKNSRLATVISSINAMSVSSTAKEMLIRYATAFTNYGIYVVDSAAQISFRADGVLNVTLKSAFVSFIRTILWEDLYIVTNSVTGATGTTLPGPVLSGSSGTLTYPAGGGTALAENTAIV